MSNGYLSFFRQFVRNPKQVGALTPSSGALGALITSEINSACAPVIELGPGTGILTRSILARGIAARDLTLVESNQDFADLLERKFPGARVLCMNAAALADVELYEGRPVGAVVSGIPFLLLSRDEAIGILSGVLRWMRPGAAIYQFTYGLGPPIPDDVLAHVGLAVHRVGTSFRNIPPATVYRLTRAAA